MDSPTKPLTSFMESIVFDTSDDIIHLSRGLHGPQGETIESSPSSSEERAANRTVSASNTSSDAQSDRDRVEQLPLHLSEARIDSDVDSRPSAYGSQDVAHIVEEDDEIQRVIELSKKTAFEDEERRKRRSMYTQQSGPTSYHRSPTTSRPDLYVVTSGSAQASEAMETVNTGLRQPTNPAFLAPPIKAEPSTYHNVPSPDSRGHGKGEPGPSTSRTPPTSPPSQSEGQRRQRPYNNYRAVSVRSSHRTPSPAPSSDSWHVPPSRRPSLDDTEECDCCQQVGTQRSFCNVCLCKFCDACWDTQAPHRNKRRTATDIPHEKTGANIARKVKNVLKPSMTDKDHENLHSDDMQTAWFGVFREGEELPLSRDYGRYQELMAINSSLRSASVTSPMDANDITYPSLVSFVGQTGAGKSSLIKLIVDLSNDQGKEFPTPVVGAVSSNLPTSEDVHLYLDPRSSNSENPILYADCEGLEGGERAQSGQY